MLNDKTRALLGDRAAQERLTDAGVLLPCCGEVPELKLIGGLKAWVVECSVNGHIHNTGFCSSIGNAVRNWNTRAAVLTPEQLKALELTREPGKFEEGNKK